MPEPLDEHRSVAKVRAALAEAGLAEAAAGVRVLGDEVRTAALAAEAIGVELGGIANSLVFAAEQHGQRTPLLVLTSGAHRADTTVLAELTGANRIGKADPGFVDASTGQSIGGVAPIGHPAPIRTIVDRALATYPTVWAAAGHPKTVYPTTFEELVALTGATVASVATR